MATSRYFDIDIYGQENPDGSAIVVFDKYAIQNSILKFLASEAGEYLYVPQMGGILETFLFTSLTPAYAQEIETTLFSILRENFSDAISNIQVIANPLFETETWEITISFSDKLNDNQKSEIIISLEDTNVAQNKFSTYIDITDTGDNLIESINYILANVTGMDEKMISYNFTEGLFIWGNYRLTNFSVSSPNFADVIALING